MNSIRRRTRLSWRPWVHVALLSVGLAVASLLSNIATDDQLSGAAPVCQTVRLVLSLLLNSGTVWAGALVVVGALVGRPGAGALAGVIAGETSLVVHYALGNLTGVMEAAIWRENLHWFATGAVMGVPLGAVGGLWSKDGALGLAARLVIPLGAAAEPLVLGLLTPAPPGADPTTPMLTAMRIVAWVLMASGSVGVLVVLWRYARRGPSAATAASR